MDVRPAAASAAESAVVSLTGRDEFQAWLAPHWDGLARFARQVSPAGEWEDVLQESVSAAWRKRRQFDPERGSPRNWLLAVVADQARKAHRRASGAALQLTDAGHEDVLADPDLERALQRLTVRQRTAVVLHYYAGLPVAAVAEVLSCSVGTVKSTLSDARTRLRRELGDGYR